MGGTTSTGRMRMQRFSNSSAHPAREFRVGCGTRVALMITNIYIGAKPARLSGTRRGHRGPPHGATAIWPGYWCRALSPAQIEHGVAVA